MSTTTTEVLEKEIETHEFHKELTVADRCDCNAQAFFIVVAYGQDLYYCNHHFRKYETKLREVSTYISDQSDKINVKPSQSSPD